jgi:hypothetical protein
MLFNFEINPAHWQCSEKNAKKTAEKAKQGGGGGGNVQQRNEK